MSDYCRNGISPALVFRDLGKLVVHVDSLRDASPKIRICLTSGTFDLLHIGHTLYLQAARSFGHFLIVGMDSDERVRNRKGPSRPIVPENERMMTLAHNRYVDAVLVKEYGCPRWELIRLVRPDTLIVTQETYTETELKQLRELCGELVVLPPQATTSTTARIRKLQLEHAEEVGKAISSRLIEGLPGFISEVLAGATK